MIRGIHDGGLVCGVWLLALLTAGAQGGFTREGTEKELRGKFPQVRPVSDQLPAGVVAREQIVYARVEGVDLALDIYQPPGAGPFPAVLIVHGGGWDSGDREMERPLGRHLAALGYVAVPVDYRLGAAGRFPAALHDLKSAVRWVRARAVEYRIDPQRIAVVGGSAGGQLAALLGASNGAAALEGEVGEGSGSSAVQAVVDIDGLADFTEPEFVRQQAEDPSAPTRFLGGPFAERAEIWRLASPLTHTGPRSAPTLFLNSTARSPVLPGRPAMAERLRALGIQAEIVVIPDTPHPFWLVHPWFDRTLAEIDRFLRRQLSGGRAPVPSSENMP